ncbi:MAG: GntR family transcriptional regulator [Propionicimonas sp.]|uniref:GntR family transcriptional regulator n=1 Tax=Propionicimonas sp. TaxID=1955623 RepID=UPI003D0C5941
MTGEVGTGDAARTAPGENAAEHVHQQLRDGILSGQYRPNQRLVEEEVAARLSVSRTPVREALLRLRHEGLVQQNRGWLVRDHAPEEILEYLEARAEVEAAAARLAASRITPAQLTGLEELLAHMEGEPNRRLFNELNSAFHDRVTEAGGNRVLAGFARSSKINYWTFSRPVVFTAAQDALVDSEHDELLAALRAGDEDAAERIARAHVRHTAAIIADALGLRVP